MESRDQGVLRRVKTFIGEKHRDSEEGFSVSALAVRVVAENQGDKEVPGDGRWGRLGMAAIVRITFPTRV